MAALGYEWHRATVSSVERGQRRVTAEEMVALALCFEVPMQVLWSAQAQFGGDRSVTLPNGAELPTGVVRGLVSFNPSLMSVGHWQSFYVWQNNEPSPSEQSF
jgi:hypothetical protein